MAYNVVITGVGGQGVLVASQIIATAAIAQGMNVRIGETHGMAQRGGSVIAHVRFGPDVHGSIIPEGQGDILLGFEPVEAARYLEFMRQGAHAIVNTHPVVPVSVSAGTAVYPSRAELETALSVRVVPHFIDATALAVEAGNTIASNTVMVGAFARAAEATKMPLGHDDLLAAVEKRVPERFAELNRKAFEKGYSAIAL
ncbi:MAG: indolepyruvate ferredoxin oxidoreductase subunit beta [Candidatus Methanofastidiosa archaeon]|jgi:indolepyruvate ferredoxin oxidoreductase beta subunit|nr:indolepyruvate ferredoxin oxidoreductase subunit beta [Candidatus Methanofastidiosa archaeon]